MHGASAALQRCGKQILRPRVIAGPSLAHCHFWIPKYPIQQTFLPGSEFGVGTRSTCAPQNASQPEKNLWRGRVLGLELPRDLTTPHPSRWAAGLNSMHSAKWVFYFFRAELFAYEAAAPVVGDEPADFLPTPTRSSGYDLSPGRRKHHVSSETLSA
jgi:hypothetical protein